MSNPDDSSKSQTILNVPNQLTAARLVLSVVLFIVIGIAQSLGSDPALQSNLFAAALVLFLVAAGTDWIDGYWARKYGQVTVLGRISDPFADKFIICGSFIFLVASDQSQISAWMAVVVVGRELLVTALRGFLEQQGKDFSANMPGKLKMVVQCATVVGSLWLLSYTDQPAPAWLDRTVLVLAWGTVLITVYSGIIYIFAAVRLLRQ
ncbi:MAG: CDP-diacylglycerol--glycerol-3-phosphate 3-phosphatidyltransferase [Pirellulales bacterium]